jgi:hypothetical protein
MFVTINSVAWNFVQIVLLLLSTIQLFINFYYFCLSMPRKTRQLINTLIGGSVAAWLSEKVLRGRGPDASGFESHRRGRIFSKEGTSARPWMCVYVYQRLTVGWWKEESTLFRPPPRGQHGFESRREGCPWVYKCCCVCL